MAQAFVRPLLSLTPFSAALALTRIPSFTRIRCPSRCVVTLQIRSRFRFFFTAATMVSFGLCIGAAGFSFKVLEFVVILVAVNFIAGLALTHDSKEWAHRLQELPFYIAFLCE